MVNVAASGILVSSFTRSLWDETSGEHEADETKRAKQRARSNEREFS